MLESQHRPKTSVFSRPGLAASNGAQADPVRAADPVDVQVLLQPVRDRLRDVESHLKATDSAVFAPLATAFIDLIGSGGKRLRPALALMAAELGHERLDAVDQARVTALAASVEMLHTATLVHDDVIDDALLRRGAPTLNASWNKGATVLAGNFLFGRAAYFAADTGNSRVITIFSRTLNVIVNGELRQLFARNNFGQVKEEYYQRIYAKTASLFCAATEGAAVLAHLPELAIQDLHDFGYNLGMAFQIVDDILDFTGDEQSLGKPAGSDLRQGTLTLPFFYYLQGLEQPESVTTQLETCHAEAMDSDDPRLWDQTVNELVHALRGSQAIAHSRREAGDFVEKARTNLADLPDNIFKHSMLGLCDFVVQRTY